MSKLPPVTAWSYSRYGLYKQCPAKFKYKHLMKLSDPSGPSADRGTQIHSMAENYIKAARKGALPPALVNVKPEIDHLRSNKAIVEQEWGFTREWNWIGRPGWFGNDVWVRIKADAITTYDDGTALAVDWKTGKRYDDHIEQAELTGLLTLMRFPDIQEVDVRFLYVDEKPAANEMQLVVPRSDADGLKKRWEKAVTPMFMDKRFAPKPNRFCGWCAFSKEKGGPCAF